MYLLSYNPRPPMLRLKFIALALIIIGCTEAEGVSSSSPTQTLLPRQEPTQTATVEHQIGPLETIGPTPTPLTHVIVEGDTLLSIAIRYGVELPDLLLANPAVNPRLLIIGDGLIVPRSGAQGPIPSATPVPIELSQIACYQDVVGEMTCLLTASVPGGSAVEGVVALVTLADSEGRALETEPAFGPINLVLPGKRIPLVATFRDLGSPVGFASAVAISALNASDIDSRYADHELRIGSIEIAADKGSVEVTGTVELMADISGRPIGLRLVVLALGENNLPVGFRTWEAPQNGSPFEFNLSVFSQGPAIISVEVIAEAPYLP